MKDQYKTREQFINELGESPRIANSYNRTLIEASVDPLVTISADGKINDVNSATEQVTGCSRDELIGTDFSDYFTEPERARAGYQRVFKEGLVKDYELEIRHRDGHVTPVTYSASVYRDESGEVTGVFAAARDITKRKQAEESLKRAHNELEQRIKERTAELQSSNEKLLGEITERKQAERALASEKQRFQALVEEAPFGMVMVGEDGSFQYINPNFIELFGYDLNEIPNGREWFIKAYPDPVYRHEVISDWIEDVKGSKRKAERYKVFTVRCKDGTDKIIHFRPVELETGKRLITCEDITDRKRAEDTIQAQIEFLNSILESLTHPFYVINANDYTIAMANSASKLDLSSGEHTCYALTHHRGEPCDGSEDPCPLEEVKKTRRSVVLEHLHYDKDSNVRNVEIHAHPIFDAQGNVAQVIEYCLDITDRKRAEEALRESEERHRSLVEHLPQRIFIKDRNSVYLSCNANYAAQLGITPEQIVGKDDFAFFPPELAQAYCVDDQACMDTGMVKDLEEPYQHAGQERWAHTIKVPYHDRQGRVIGVLGIFEDITDRKQMEEELRQSEERYRSLVEDSFDGIFIQKGPKIIFANSRLYEMLSYSPGELEGMDHWLVYRPDYQDVTRRRAIARMRGEKVTPQYEVMMQEKDGSSFLAEIRARQVQVDGEPGVKVWIRDISGQRRSEEAQRRLAIAIDQAAEGIVITDATGIIQYVNPAEEAITGYSSDELLGRKDSIFKSDEHDENFYRNLWETINCGNVWFGRFINRKKDGTEYHEDDSISPVYDKSGNLTNFVAVKHDVTKQLTLQEQLLQAQKMEAIGTLAGGFAHDFNNKLQIIRGYVDLILFNKDLSEIVKSNLGVIKQTVDGSAELIKGMMVFSRKTPLEVQPIDLNKLVAQTSSMLTRSIPKMIEIDLLLADDLWSIKAAPNQIDQILMNLAVNARDAMPDGGKLTIQTRNTASDEEFCRFYPDTKAGRYALIEVSDTGTGMDKETVSRIFEPFFTTKEKGKGTGLGLSVVYRIVELHGGTIICDSELSVGTTFRIYFPAIEEVPEEQYSEKKEPPKGRGETILLVDDELHFLETTSRLLAGAKYRVITASSGKEALELYEKHREEIRLVVLDLIMPGMGGEECLRALLSMDQNSRLLMVSGFQKEGIAEDLKEAGARGFIVKPFDMPQLLEKIRKIIDEE